MLALKKKWKRNVVWVYLFGQGGPNETKGTINLKHFCNILLTRWILVATD